MKDYDLPTLYSSLEVHAQVDVPSRREDIEEFGTKVDSSSDEGNWKWQTNRGRIFTCNEKYKYFNQSGDYVGKLISSVYY